MKTIVSLIFLTLANLVASAQVSFISAESGTNGQPVTAALLNSSTLGSIGKWTVNGIVNVSTDYAALTTSPCLVDGIIYLNHPVSTRSFVVSAVKSRQYIRNALNSTSSRLSISFDLKLKGFKGQSWGYYDLGSIEGGGEYTVLAFKDFPGNEFAFRVHTRAGVGIDIKVSPDKNYKIKMLWDQTERLATLKVLEDENLVGISTLVLQNQPSSAVYLGRYDDHSASAVANIYYDNIQIDPTGKSFFEAETIKPVLTPTVYPADTISDYTTTVVLMEGYKTNKVVSVTTNLVYTTNITQNIEKYTYFATNYFALTNPAATTSNYPPIEITNLFPNTGTNAPLPLTNSAPSSANLSTNTITAMSASWADARAAYLQVKEGGTLIIPGFATWTSSFVVDKRITIKGLGLDNTVITFNLPTQTTSGFIVVANGARITSMQIRGLKSANRGRAIEVKADKCVLDSLFIDQMYWGMYLQYGFNLVYNVHFRDCQKFIRFHGRGAGTYNWDNYYPIAFDSLNYAVVEDCLFEDTEEMPNVGVLNAISSQQGASWIVRNSTFLLTKHAYGPILDAHGNIDPQLRGVVSVQVINNHFRVNSPAEFYKLFDWRGGSGVFASNTVVAASGEMIVLREEDTFDNPLTPPFTDPHSQIYIWGNKIDPRVTPLRIDVDDLDTIKEDSEYFMIPPANFKSVPYPHPLRK